jgi:short-subunit dehydrogenase
VDCFNVARIKLMVNAFDGKLILVTGASSGIGKQTALDFAELGARLILVARREHLLRDVARTAGSEVHVYPCDLADNRARTALIHAIKQDQDIPDIIVNNAGYGNYRSFLEESSDDIIRMMEINYQAAAHLISAFLPDMVARATGAVVNVSSGAGKIALPYMAVYCASKFALCALTESLAYEMEGSGVTVHLVNPGPVETEFFQAGVWKGRIPDRKATPAEVSKTIRRAILNNRRVSYVPFKRGVMVYVFNLLGPLGRVVMRRKIRR